MYDDLPSKTATDEVVSDIEVVDSADALVAWPEKPNTGFAGWFGRPIMLELRAPFERKALRQSPIYNGVGVPKGEGRPVLVVPGFFAAQDSADDLITILDNAGWDISLADVGRNAGPAYNSLSAAEENLKQLTARTKKPVTIIGHSRGGQFARVMAVRHPETVRQVITVGSPLCVKYPKFAVVNLPASILDRLWRLGLFGPVYPAQEDAVDRDRYRSFPAEVDFVSIYSKSDGIVDWRLSLDPAARHVEVQTSHRAIWNSVNGVRAIVTAMADVE